MRPRAILGLAAVAAALAGAALIFMWPQGPPPPLLTAEQALGHDLLAGLCAPCHSVERTGESPRSEAPAFRTLHQRYDVADLEEALVEGLVSGHTDMPEYIFEPDQAEAIIAYLKSLEF